jgi:hypothetical protein
MRTRIALVAIIPVALSTTTTLSQAATTRSARAQTISSPGAEPSTAVALPPDRLVAYQDLAAGSDRGRSPALAFDVDATILSLGHRAAVGPADHPGHQGHPAPAPAAPAALSPDRLIAYRNLTDRTTGSAPAALPFAVDAALVSHPAVGVLAGVVTAAVTPPAAGLVDTVTPAQRASWERVALCEEGGNWSSSGSRFSGGLGITRANWAAYGGREFAPEGAMATEDQQIMVAERIESTPPDQHGCRGW